MDIFGLKIKIDVLCLRFLCKYYIHTLMLFQKWPDMKSKLHVTLNQPLPDNLRQLAWRLYLDNTKGKSNIIIVNGIALLSNMSYP